MGCVYFINKIWLLPGDWDVVNPIVPFPPLLSKSIHDPLNNKHTYHSNYKSHFPPININNSRSICMIVNIPLQSFSNTNHSKQLSSFHYHHSNTNHSKQPKARGLPPPIPTQPPTLIFTCHKNLPHNTLFSGAFRPSPQRK